MDVLLFILIVWLFIFSFAERAHDEEAKIWMLRFKRWGVVIRRLNDPKEKVKVDDD